MAPHKPIPPRTSHHEILRMTLELDKCEVTRDETPVPRLILSPVALPLDGMVCCGQGLGSFNTSPCSVLDNSKHVGCGYALRVRLGLPASCGPWFLEGIRQICSFRGPRWGKPQITQGLRTIWAIITATWQNLYSLPYAFQRRALICWLGNVQTSCHCICFFKN
jgi:hypothetical protein